MKENFRMLAKTMYGFEPLLARELRSLGANRVKEGNRSVEFFGDKGFMYKANLCLRTALKILKPINQFPVNSEEELYWRIFRMDWHELMEVTDSFMVDTTINSPYFKHSKYTALKTKDAIVDHFRKADGKRPDVNLEDPDLRINVHIENRICTISIDSSGESLHKRGYRSSTNIAPINEVLAAGLLLHSGWHGQSDFLDPMCGSGTILIEAAMIACNIPPNLNKKTFAFEKWKDWDVDLYEKIEASALKKITDFNHRIIGFDKAPSAIRKAEENIENAHLSEFISVEQKDFFQSKKESVGPLHMLFNPPYGERLEVNMSDFYGKIGDTLKQNYPGTEAWFITSKLEAMKNVGLKPARKIKTFNGKLESRLLKYEIYEGSRKFSKK